MLIEQTRHFNHGSELLDVWMPILIQYIDQFHNYSANYHRGLKGGIDQVLRILTGSHASFVSVELLNQLRDAQNKSNPFELIWEDRHKMSIQTDKGLITPVWEHSIPINELRNTILELRTFEKVYETLTNYPGIAWITKEEDNRLVMMKLHKARPNGFLPSYQIAGINLLNKEEYESRIKNI
jgi:hypothetical protein